MSTMTLKAMLFGEDVSMGKALKGAGKEAENTGGKLSGMGGVAKAALTAGAVVAVAGFAKSCVDSFKEVGGQVIGLQRIMGGTPEEMSRLRFAAEESGVSYETLAKSTGKFEKAAMAAGEAADKQHAKMGAQTVAMFAQRSALEALHHPTQAQKDKIQQLTNSIDDNIQALHDNGQSAYLMGIQVRDATGHMIPMTKLLPEIAEKFKNMPNGTEKTALAMKLFGKAGADMLPFLNRGKAGLADLAKESDRFGLTLTGKNVQALRDAKKNQREWGAAVEGVKVQFGAQLLPILTQFTTFLTSKAIPEIVKITTYMHTHEGAIKKVAIGVAALSVVTGISTALTTAYGMAMTVQAAGGLKAWFMGTKLMTAGQWLLNAALDANPIGIVIIAIAALVAGLVWAYKNVGWFRAAVDTGFHAIATMATWLWNNIFAPVIRFILNGFSAVAGAIGHVLQALGNIPGFGWAKTAGNMMIGAANAAHTLANNINNINDKTVTVTVDFAAHNSMTGPAASAVQQAAFAGKHYASGGTNIAGGWKLVGEQGPELMWTPGGETILPAGKTASILSGHGGSSVAGAGGDTFNVMVPPGTTRQQAMGLLAEFKRLKRGGVSLGLA